MGYSIVGETVFPRGAHCIFFAHDGFLSMARNLQGHWAPSDIDITTR